MSGAKTATTKQREQMNEGRGWLGLGHVCNISGHITNQQPGRGFGLGQAFETPTTFVGLSTDTDSRTCMHIIDM